MNSPIIIAMSKALADTQRALESERARNEQLCSQLHWADQREAKYQELIREQVDLIELLEGHPVKAVSDVA